MGANYTINPLFDFQLICDTDMGISNLIKRDYYDKDVFDNTIFQSKDKNFLKEKLVCRKLFNPLHLFCKKGIMKDEEIDDLYREFLEKEYKTILQLSIPTAVMQFVSMSNKLQQTIHPVILCKNQDEVDWIKQHDSDLKCIIADYENFDISKYDTIYLKDIYTLLLFNQSSINKKNINIGRYAFNFDILKENMEVPILEVAKNYYLKNQFYLIDVYHGISIIEKE